jgi:pyridoxamine 5'-phosphate oxidase
MTNPLDLLREWVTTDELALATASADGRPSVRMVLLKSADETGFVFCTNYESRKGLELLENPYAALLFREPDIQVRIEGSVERVAPEESDAVWEARPAESRRSATASRQSQPIGSREQLEAAVAAQPDEPPRPAYWGCYRLVPESYEFWRHRANRLHERRLFTRHRHGWQETLLQP